MMTRLFSLGACGMTLALAGCVGTIDGKHTGGVPFVSDTVEARYDRPLATVLKAAKATLASYGTLTVENVVGNTLEAKLDKRTVWVSVEALTPASSRLLIQVRTSGGGTDKLLAHELDKQIILRLATGNFIVTPVAPPAPAPAPAPAVTPTR